MRTWIILLSIVLLVVVISLLKRIRAIFAGCFSVKSIILLIIFTVSILLMIYKYAAYKNSPNYILSIKAHQGPVMSLKQNPDGTFLASSGMDGYIKIWQVPEGKLIKVLPRQKYVYLGMAFSQDGKYFAIGGVNIKIYETKTWELIKTLYLNKKHEAKIGKLKVKGNYFRFDTNFYAISFTPDSKKIAGIYS